MINLETFLLGLLIVSTLTSLVTEAVKKVLDEFKLKYHSNTLVGIVAVILSCAIGIGYIAIAGCGFTASSIVCIIALIFMSWLAAMVGYDKVVQIINQITTGRKG